MANMHIHTYSSDGRHSHKKIIEKAYKNGEPKAIVFTDHDYVPFEHERKKIKEYADELGIRAEFGMEIEVNGGIHMLGYNVSPEKDPWTYMRHQTNEDKFRQDAFLEVCKNLKNNYQLRIDLNDVLKLGAVTDSEGIIHQGPLRWKHLAKVISKEAKSKSFGQMDSVKKVEKLWVPGGPLFVGKKTLPAESGIKKIKKMGGIPIIAHPMRIPAETNKERDKIIYGLLEAGAEGIEAIHYSYEALLEENKYYKLAKEKGLYTTGGSDMHGNLDDLEKNLVPIDFFYNIFK